MVAAAHHVEGLGGGLGSGQGCDGVGQARVLAALQRRRLRCGRGGLRLHHAHHKRIVSRRLPLDPKTTQPLGLDLHAANDALWVALRRCPSHIFAE